MVLRGRTASGGHVQIRVADDGSFVIDGLAALVEKSVSPLGMWQAGTVQSIVANTPFVLPNVPCQEVMVVADEGNSARIFTNKSGGTINATDTLGLEADQVQVVSRVANTNEVTVFTLASGQKVRWMYRG